MNGDKPFQVQLVDAIITAPSAGNMATVAELNVNPENKFRRIWCFFDNTTMTSAGDQAWIRFYRDGALVTELPALVVIVTASFAIRAAHGPIIYTASNINVGGRNVIWYNNTDANPYYAVHPFDVLCEADTVRLESSKGGTTRAMLAVLSTPAAIS